MESIASEIKAASANPNAEEEQKREAADLRAQQDMAYWAWAMFATTVVTAVLTGIGVLLVGFTLVYTARTLREAERATEAANRTVTVTREIGEAQTRAYLSVVRAGLRTTRDGVLELTFTISNIGNSPAKATQLSYFASIDGDHARPQGGIVADPEIRDIAPGRDEIFTHALEDLRLVSTEIDALSRRESFTMKVRTCLEYVDVFEATVSQEIEWQGPVKPEGLMGLRRVMPAVNPLKISRPTRH